VPGRGVQLGDVIPFLLRGLVRHPLEIHFVFMNQLVMVGIGVGNKYRAGCHAKPLGEVVSYRTSPSATVFLQYN